MKILQVLHDYLPSHVGGSEIHAHELALAMQRRGHRVTCAFTERDLAREEGAIGEGALDGVRTIERVHQREYADVGETWVDARAEAALALIVERERPDVVHFHHLMGWGPRCLSIARELGARVVMTLHDYHALCDRSTLLRADGSICRTGIDAACGSCLERHPLLASPARSDDDSRARAYEDAGAARRAAFRAHFESVHAFVSPSSFLAGVYARAGLIAPTAIERLPYGSSGAMQPSRERTAGTTLRVGYVGGLYRDKGVHVLVDALRELERRDVELHVHGVLEWFPDYVRDLRERARGMRAIFHGGFDPRDVDRVYRTFDVLCVPSVWFENAPLAIQDAYRHGVPVIASDLGGLAELVPHEVCGMRFAPGDAHALAQAIARVADDPELACALARARPPTPHIDDVAARIEELYRGAPPRAASARASELDRWNHGSSPRPRDRATGRRDDGPTTRRVDGSVDR